MKILLIWIGLVILCFGTSGQRLVYNKQTRIYIVRHAEKEAGKDPILTAAGRNRAGDLMRRLKQEKLQRIYVTEYRRTQQTGDSLRILLHIDTVQYVADTVCDDLLRKLAAHHDLGRSILIIGHSNTIPFIIRKLGFDKYPKGNIPDNEFDNLFLISFKGNKARLTVSKYGLLSGSAVSLQPMQKLQ